MTFRSVFSHKLYVCILLNTLVCFKQFSFYKGQISNLSSNPPSKLSSRGMNYKIIKYISTVISFISIYKINEWINKKLKIRLLSAVKKDCVLNKRISKVFNYSKYFLEIISPHDKIIHEGINYKIIKYISIVISFISIYEIN